VIQAVYPLHMRSVWPYVVDMGVSGALCTTYVSSLLTTTGYRGCGGLVAVYQECIIRVSQSLVHHAV